MAQIDPFAVDAAAIQYADSLSGDASSYAHDAIEILRSAKKTGISAAELSYKLSQLWPGFEGSSVINSLTDKFCEHLRSGRHAWLGPKEGEEASTYVPPSFYDMIDYTMGLQRDIERRLEAGDDVNKIVTDLVSSGKSPEEVIQATMSYMNAFKKPALNGQAYVPTPKPPEASEDDA